MSMVRLSVTSYVVLGLIALRGPSTSYDLKRAIGHSVGHFWPFPHAQLYAEPERLAEAGLLSMEREPGSRRRKTYRLTSEGESALRAWLKEPVGEAFQLRNVAELKLFFGELAAPEDLRNLAREQLELHRARLEEFDAITQRFENSQERHQRLVPLRLGTRLERAAMEFWAELLDELE